MKVQGSVLGRCISTILISFAFFLSEQARAEDPVHVLQNRKLEELGLLIEPRYSFLNTDQNFNDDGTRVPLPDQFSVARHYFDLSFAYALAPGLSIFARASALWQKTSSSLANQTSHFAFSDQMVGLNQALTQTSGASRLWFQFDFTFPAYHNEESSEANQFILGDQSNDFTSALFYNIAIAHGFSLEWGAAYRYRSRGYSSSIPLSFRISKNANELGLSYALAARAEISLKTDPGPGSAVDDAEAGEVAEPLGGSHLVNARNSQNLSAGAEIAFRTNTNARYCLEARAPVLGNAYPVAFTLAAQASFFFASPAPASAWDKEAESKEAYPDLKEIAGGPVQYNLQAKISGMNDQLFLLKIDRGSRDEIKSGQSFDIFSETELVARARVISVKDDEAALNVIEYYQDHSIDLGFAAKRIAPSSSELK